MGRDVKRVWRLGVTASKWWAFVVGFIAVTGVAGGAAWLRQRAPETAVASLGLPLMSLPVQAPEPPQHTAAAEPLLPPAPVTTTPAIKVAEAPASEAIAPVPPTSAEPKFDIVRVEPSGDTVLAGKGAPNADVALVASGKVVAEAKADQNGQFVILPPALKPGDYDLSLRQKDGARPAIDSTQSVAVSVPKAHGGPVVVALAEPGKPTKVLSAAPIASQGADTIQAQPLAPKTEAPIASRPKDGIQTGMPAKVAVAKLQPDLAHLPSRRDAKAPLGIRSVDLENGTGFFASGAVAPGTPIHVYLNNSHVADVVGGPDGQWSVTIRKGLTGGHYVVRADAVGDKGAVKARVEVPFDVPVTMAAASAPGAMAAAAKFDVKGPRQTAAAVAEEATIPGTTPVALPSSDTRHQALPHDETAAAEGQPRFAPPAAVADMKPAKAQDAVVEQVDTALVVTGDNLWNISRARLGHGRRYTQIYAANTAQIRDPRLIYPGQVFVMPTP